MKTYFAPSEMRTLAATFEMIERSFLCLQGNGPRCLGDGLPAATGAVALRFSDGPFHDDETCRSTEGYSLRSQRTVRTRRKSPFITDNTTNGRVTPGARGRKWGFGGSSQASAKLRTNQLR